MTVTHHSSLEASRRGYEIRTLSEAAARLFADPDFIAVCAFAVLGLAISIGLMRFLPLGPDAAAILALS